MTKAPEWRPVDFGDLERRLTEAKALLERAARLLEAREMEKVSTLAEMHLEEEKARHGHAFGRRYR